ncbi:MAG: MFS transporter [Actinomycetota bacterium]|nr:MFS transporter [Actinomycetota bacterium]
MIGPGSTLTRTWPDEPGTRAALCEGRDDLLVEQREPDDAQQAGTVAEWTQQHGPFRSYRRRVHSDGDRLVETTSFELQIPWFGWMYRPLIRGRMRRLDARDRSPWWAPSDHLDARQVLVLGLVAALSMSSAFINTLFTQTVNFAADDFGTGDWGIGVGGSIVRAGILIAMPAAFIADRIGRRRVIAVVAWAAPIITALGALAPNFGLLVATQAIGRPLGLALDFLIAVVAAEEMPRNSRAYAVSVMALASGLGASLAIIALPLADLGEGAWRLLYVLTLVWLVVAVDVVRRLPETVRFQTPHVVGAPLDRRRFAVLGGIALLANIFVAPASFFQNRYLEDARGFSATTIAAFTLVTATPAALGLVVGGRIADARGRRRLIAIALPLGTALVAGSFAIGGPAMWGFMASGAVVGSLAYPAISVYRSEIFPTGGRGRAAGLLTMMGLMGGIGGLLAAGGLLDAGWSYGQVMGLLALAQIGVFAIVVTSLPETAHRTLEELNPQDRIDQRPTVT